MEVYLICLSGWFAETYTTNLEKPKLSFWNIGKQRQIWSQHCRCIKHFSRGINVVLLHRLCRFSLKKAILLSEISAGKTEWCWSWGIVCSFSPSPLQLIQCMNWKPARRRTLKPLLHLMKMNGSLETLERVIFLSAKSQKKYLQSVPFLVFCTRWHFEIVLCL